MTTETPPANQITLYEGEPLEEMSRDRLLEVARAAQDGRRKVRAA